MKVIVHAEHESGEGIVDQEFTVQTLHIDPEGDLTIYTDEGTTVLYPAMGWAGFDVSRF